MIRPSRIESRRPLFGLLLITLVGCTGSSGPAGPPGTPGTPGTPAVDRGSIAGTVKDPNGGAIASASIATDPATATTQTDATGNFTLEQIPVGAYTVIASKNGYVDTRLPAVGVGAGATVRVSLVLAPEAATTGSLSGTIRGRSGSSAASIAGAQVCIEGGSNCVTSGSDGTYSLTNVAPGFVFVSASATGYLTGETRQATHVVAGGTTSSVDVMLSGKPMDDARYIGATFCVTCHTTFNPSDVSGWQSSAHFGGIDHSTGHLDVSGWPSAPPDCTAPATADTGVAAADPTLDSSAAPREVFVVRWGASCGTGKPAFAMAFDTNQNGAVDAADTIVAVTGTTGGVASGAGQCGSGGIMPTNVPCTANIGGTTASRGWWQQEYLVAIGPGASKPAWVTWDTSNAPTDALILPAAWNQRSQSWVSAPDYDTTQGGTWSKQCSGCHETGVTLAADIDGNVTSFASVAANISCEKCHGPGSTHASNPDAKYIVSPAYLTAQSQRELCGQCHTQGAGSATPAGAFGFAWNSAATLGGGNFIPGVHQLSDFETNPTFGDPNFYWPGGFANADHLTYIDFGTSAHVNNNYEKLTCEDCHSSHSLVGGPSQFVRVDAQTSDKYVFQDNGGALRDDVICLGCHATHGPFAPLALADVARYHISIGGSVQKNGTTMTATTDDEAASASLVGQTVRSHMIAEAAMPAYFDPTGIAGLPVGRCSSCHMAKTAATATYYSGPDGTGRTANVIGDVSSHTFRVAWPDASLATLGAATTWDTVMPNACGSCHADYRFGK
jgi:hypothetical protein